MPLVQAALNLLNYFHLVRTTNFPEDYIIQTMCFIEQQVILAFVPHADPPVTPPTRGVINKTVTISTLRFLLPFLEGRLEKYVIGTVISTLMQMPEEWILVQSDLGQAEAGMMAEDGGLLDAII